MVVANEGEVPTLTSFDFLGASWGERRWSHREYLDKEKRKEEGTGEERTWVCGE